MKIKLYYFLSFLLILTVFLFIVIKNNIIYAPISLFPLKQLVKLSYVIDGDTIIVDGKKKVRYIGINTPELKTQTSPDECFARKALDENKKILENKQIFMEKDVSEVDKYNRLLRYVWANNTFVNDYLIRNGFAKIDIYPPDTKYYLQFKQAQQEAKDNNRGLWRECPSS
jgi:micrococcal nuclease